MSKNEYERTAAQVKEGIRACEANGDYLGARTLRQVARNLARIYTEENAYFDREAFLNGCGVTDEGNGS